MPAFRRARRIPPLCVAILLFAACSDAPEVRSFGEFPAVAALEGPDAVPRELAAALLAPLGLEREPAPRVLVGSLPPDLPFAIDLPAEARLLGSLAYRSHGTVVAAVTDPPGRAARDFEARLRRAGWTDPPAWIGGGFQGSDATRPVFLCRGGNRSLNVSALARPEQGSYLRIGYAAHRRHSPCDPRERRRDPFRDAPIPTLHPPAGAQVRDEGMGGSQHYFETHARLETVASPVELVAHYGSQLRERGWSLVDGTAGGATATQTWRFAERGGREWQGVLLATSLPGSARRELMFRVTDAAWEE